MKIALVGETYSGRSAAEVKNRVDLEGELKKKGLHEGADLKVPTLEVSAEVHRVYKHADDSGADLLLFVMLGRPGLGWNVVATVHEDQTFTVELDGIGTKDHNLARTLGLIASMALERHGLKSKIPLGRWAQEEPKPEEPAAPPEAEEDAAPPAGEKKPDAPPEKEKEPSGGADVAAKLAELAKSVGGLGGKLDTMAELLTGIKDALEPAEGEAARAKDIKFRIPSPLRPNDWMQERAARVLAHWVKRKPSTKDVL